MQSLIKATLSLAIAGAIFSSASAQAPNQAASSSAVENYIVVFGDDGALYYDGDIAGLRATSPKVTGSKKFNAEAVATKAYRTYLEGERAEKLGEISSLLGSTPTLTHEYDITFNGVSLKLNADQAAKVASLAGVKSIRPAGTYELATDAGPQWIGAPAVWTGGQTIGGNNTRGQGIVIGTLDSGANQDHPSFSNDASCGFNAGNPKLRAARDCFQSNCDGGDPEDTSVESGGHGVHTASISSGNRLVPPLTVNGVALQWEISGVAPCATVISYKVCGSSSCDGSAIFAAINRSVVDGIDVANYSISGGRSPWSDADRGFLDMVNADIFVAASAGNTRAATPDPVGQVNHRGPWVMTVAMSTHDRIVSNRVDVVGGPQNVYGLKSAAAFATDVVAQIQPASIAPINNELGCTSTGGIPAGSMSGKIGLISRGSCTFEEKINNAIGAGAVGVVVYNNTPSPPIPMGLGTATGVPSVMVPQTSGIAIRNFVASNPTAQGSIESDSLRSNDASVADILDGGSLRGPNADFDVTKPDITGPGVNIYAAVNDVNGQFGFLTGTSMSGPMVAGAGALVRAANPTWTPQEVKSAIQLTANTAQRKPNGVDAADGDDVGNGRVNMNSAAKAGLVMNETFNNFLNAQPGSGSLNPRDLNLPSMRHTNCLPSCTFSRTVRNTRFQGTTWTFAPGGAPAGVNVSVSPTSFNMPAGVPQTQTITFTYTPAYKSATNQPATLTALSFGGVTYTPNSAAVPNTRFAAAIRVPDGIFVNAGFEQ
jgi:hypothetical protein